MNARPYTPPSIQAGYLSGSIVRITWDVVNPIDHNRPNSYELFFNLGPLPACYRTPYGPMQYDYDASSGTHFETLHFDIAARNHLGFSDTVRASITCCQEDLRAPLTITGVSASYIPGQQIKVTWDPVDDTYGGATFYTVKALDRILRNFNTQEQMHQQQAMHFH
jgi:hypothetical protein